MKKLLYYKLVRDRIPEIIEEAHKQFSVRELDEEEIRRFGLKKLAEEVQEFIEDPSAEEAADILEILEFVCRRFDVGDCEIHAERLAKRVTKGSFDKGVLLEWVEE